MYLDNNLIPRLKKVVIFANGVRYYIYIGQTNMTIHLAQLHSTT